jgi:hypothetical protein
MPTHTIAQDIVTARTTVANTVVETQIFASTVTANRLKAGKVVRVLLSGIYTTANASDTFTLRFKIAGTTLETVVSTGKSVSGTPWNAIWTCTVRTVGASGTLIDFLQLNEDNVELNKESGTAVTFDTTADEEFTATVQWSSANANNRFSVDQGFLELLG